MENRSERLLSLDAFRGLTILTMVFVNDIAGGRGVPGWLRHAGTHDDAMTFVDLVFPAFIFIMGAAVPFALSREVGEEESPSWLQLGRAAARLLARTASLLIVGILMVNLASYAADLTGISKDWYNVLLYVSLILTWNAWPQATAQSVNSVGASSPASGAEPNQTSGRSGWGNTRYLAWLLRGIGVLGLVAAAVIYRGRADGQVVWLRHQWWGIVGLIGWAYFVAGLIYLTLRRHYAAVLLSVPMLAMMFIAERNGAFRGLGAITNYLNLGSQIGTHGAIATAGLAVGLLFFPGSPARTPRERIGWMLGLAAAWAAAGWMLRPGIGISKDLATPAWGFYSAAISSALFAAIYWLIDVRGIRAWCRPLLPAGRNALLAYILAPLVVALLGVAGVRLYTLIPDALNAYPAVVLRSLGFTALILGLTWALGKSGVRLRF